jgi:hypothetical protein
LEEEKEAEEGEITRGSPESTRGGRLGIIIHKYDTMLVK